MCGDSRPDRDEARFPGGPDDPQAAGGAKRPGAPLRERGYGAHAHRGGRGDTGGGYLRACRALQHRPLGRRPPGHHQGLRVPAMR